MNARRTLALVAATTAATLAGAGGASATTFCVPGFSPECPDNGTNVAKATATEAMVSNASDGQPDKVILGPQVFSEPDGIVSDGTDPLEVIGAGSDQTVLTTTSTDPIYVARFYNRDSVKVSGLKVIVPASMPDGSGAGVSLRNGEMDGVDVEVRNPGTQDALSMFGDNVVQNSRVFASGEGSIGAAFNVSAAVAGSNTITGAEVTGSVYGVLTDSDVTFSQGKITDPVGAAIRATSGGRVNVENSVIKTTGTPAVTAVTVDGLDQDVSVKVNRSTVFSDGKDFGGPAIHGQVADYTGGGSIDLDVTDSIFSGYSTNWKLLVPAGPRLGGASLSVSHSNFAQTPAQSSDGVVEYDTATNIDQDPLFVGPDDFHLSQGSPSIDAGNPDFTGQNVDFDGNPRPFDGNGDGVAVADQGAFEFQQNCETDPSL